MKTDKQIFISYAHLDNNPVGEKPGWISRFHESLEGMLTTRLGYPANIWRDDRLQGNDIYAAEIMDQLRQTAAIISILSPRYLLSFWCSKEATEFYNKAMEGPGVSVKNKARFFKIIKTPFPQDETDTLPQILKDIQGYDFFIYDNDVPMELDPVYGEKFGQDFLRKICQLSWNIAKFIKDLETASVPINTPAAETPIEKPTVYLAHCSYDLRNSREILETGLKRLGYKVLPETNLPYDEEGYMREVEHLLSLSKVSIHLVGNSYGAIPDGLSQKSSVILQNEIAVRRSKSGNFSRFIWSPVRESPDPKQQAFIDAVHQDADLQYGADLISGDLEELKASVHARLENRVDANAGKARPGRGGKDARLIYMICDQKDIKSTVPVRKYLRQQGFEVELPVFEGDAAAVRESNKQLIIGSDGVILFYGAGSEAWKRTVTNDLKKTGAYCDERGPQPTYIYLSPPKTAIKEDLIDIEEPNLINGLDGFSEEAMAGFVLAMGSMGNKS